MRFGALSCPPFLDRWRLQRCLSKKINLNHLKSFVENGDAEAFVTSALNNLMKLIPCGLHFISEAKKDYAP